MMTENQLGNYLRKTRYFIKYFNNGEFDLLLIRENREVLNVIKNYFLAKEDTALDYREVELLDNLLTLADIVYRQGRYDVIMTDEEYDKLEQLGLHNDIKEKMSSEAIMDCPKLRDAVIKYNLGVNPIISLNSYRDDRRMTETLHDYAQLQGTIQKVKAFEKNSKYKSVEWYLDSMGIKNDHREYILVCSRKYDGNSVIATIRDGRVVKAVTRGVDGKGKDLTEYMTHLRYDALPDMGVAFECILKESSLLKLKDIKGSTYKNCRSGLQGILGDLDGVQYKELLTFVPLKSSNMFTYRFDEIKMLNDICGQDVSLHYKTIKGTRAELEAMLKSIIEFEARNRQNLGYMIDGLVIEYIGYAEDGAYYDTRMDIGRDQAARINRWECAYKFESEELVTRLKEVKFTVGRTGKITPMAYFEDIQFSNGNEYTKASLGSIRRVAQELDLRKDDLIVIQYSNDVIPYVSRVVTENHTGRTVNRIVVPHECPVCGVRLKEVGDEVKCINPRCSAKTLLSIPQALKLLGAKNISNKTVELLNSEGLLNKFEDLFTLKDKRDALIAVKGLGEKKVDMILNEIETIKSTPIPPHILMASLGLESAGRRLFEKILSEIGHVELMGRIEALWDTFYEMITGDYDILNHETGYDIIKDEDAIPIDNNYKKALAFINKNMIGLGMSEDDAKLMKVILENYTMDDIITNVLGMASQVMKFSIKYGLLDKYIKDVKSAPELIDTLKEDLENIPGIGEITALDLIAYMTPDKISQYKTCCELLNVEDAVASATGNEAKFKVVLSGFRDKDGSVAEKLALVGAVLVDNMSSDTDLLIVDDRSKTTSKTKKAEKYKTPIFDINDFTHVGVDYLLEVLTKGNSDEIIM